MEIIIKMKICKKANKIKFIQVSPYILYNGRLKKEYV
jgi:hypothetical protein